MRPHLEKPEGFASHQAMCKAAADRIIDLVRKKPNAVLGLATGGTMEPLYDAIVKRYRDSLTTDTPISFKNVTFFTLDEYIGLPKAHLQSYHSYLHHHLFDHIDAKPEHINIPDGNALDIFKECQRYEAALAKAGGVDVWLLGIGANGHIAFNEPDAKFTGTTSKVKLTPSTREANSRFFDDDISKVPTHAISVGLGTIRNHAREVMLLATGYSKAAPIATLLEGRIRHKTPATSLTLRPNVHIYADTATLSVYHKNQAGRGIG